MTSILIHTVILTDWMLAVMAGKTARVMKKLYATSHAGHLICKTRDEELGPTTTHTHTQVHTERELR